MGFPRQEYWSGLPFSSPGALPNPRLKPMSLALAGGFFTTEPPGNAIATWIDLENILSEISHVEKTNTILFHS